MRPAASTIDCSRASFGRAATARPLAWMAASRRCNWLDNSSSGGLSFTGIVLLLRECADKEEFLYCIAVQKFLFAVQAGILLIDALIFFLVRVEGNPVPGPVRVGAIILHRMGFHLVGGAGGPAGRAGVRAIIH